jgi:hypothetical protein
LTDFKGFEEALSNERFGAYLESCEGDRAKALALYGLNARVSASLYVPIQVLEVTLRNRFHHHLSETYGECWYERGGVITHVFQRQKISDALAGLAMEKRPIEPGRVVASLTLGFWTACVSGPYEDTLWRRGGLAKAFMKSGEKPQRKKVMRLVTPIRKLRNRIAHHEPILYWDLAKHHRNIFTLTDWLMPVAAEWAKAESTFETFYDEEFSNLMLKPADRA